MNILTCAPNNFITAAPPPRQLHAPHPCRGSLASRLEGLSYEESRPGGLSYGETLTPRWRADDTAAPEIRITPPLYTDVNCPTVLCTRRQTEHPLGQRSYKRAPRGYLRCTAYLFSSSFFCWSVSPKGLFTLHRIPSWKTLLQKSHQGAIRVAPKMTMTARLQTAPPRGISPSLKKGNVS